MGMRKITKTGGVIITTSPNEIKLDHQIKKVLACKPILSRILQRVVEECKNMTPEEVEKCIGENVLVDTVPLEPGFTNSLEVIEGASEEDYVSGEGIVFYDVKTCLHLPNGKEYIKIIIDVEAQKNDNPGYSIPLRALYYCSRQVSSQLGVEFTNKTGDKIKYDGLKKVYSIWICSETAKFKANTIERYRISQEMLYGERCRDSRYDLMEALIINIGKVHNTSFCDDALICMLSDLLDETIEVNEKIRILEEKHRIPMTEEIKQEVDDMCKYTAQVKATGEEKLSKLISLLLASGRLDDISEATKSREGREKLYKEFGIK